MWHKNAIKHIFTQQFNEFAIFQAWCKKIAIFLTIFHENLAILRRNRGATLLTTLRTRVLLSPPPLFFLTLLLLLFFIFLPANLDIDWLRSILWPFCETERRPPPPPAERTGLYASHKVSIESRPLPSLSPLVFPSRDITRK